MLTISKGVRPFFNLCCEGKCVMRAITITRCTEAVHKGSVVQKPAGLTITVNRQVSDISFSACIALPSNSLVSDRKCPCLVQILFPVEPGSSDPQSTGWQRIFLMSNYDTVSDCVLLDFQLMPSEWRFLHQYFWVHIEFLLPLKAKCTCMPIITPSLPLPILALVFWPTGFRPQSFTDFQLQFQMKLCSTDDNDAHHDNDANKAIRSD